MSWLSRSKTTARDTGTATASRGGVANSGVINGPVIVDGRPAAKSAYREQVKRMAPTLLVGRERELDELAAFSVAEGPDAYVWWLAPPWAGKSALMSWFALNGPSGARVVSFFITARWSGQSDRVGFTDVMIEQLAELLEEPRPLQMTEATRDVCFLDLLRRGADACLERGERLVLLIDGLDEDRGVIAGAGSHSIAALLPVDPPENLRIIVSGRPNPPIPQDVPAEHPLRDPAVVRPLATSPAATVRRTDMLRELDALLRGAPAEQDLLGLVTAAGGGLSAADLADLSGLMLWEVREHLEAVVGRSFSPRQRHWTMRPGDEVYVLGHEELQQVAVERIGEKRLAGYRQRLHEWADRYCGLGWPPETPEYLLRGYFRLLRVHDETQRVVKHATDSARHDRMLDITGGDTAGFAEVETAQELLLNRPGEDLYAAVFLARHRDRLRDRNEHIPAALPALWARLGHASRAEALAKAIPDLVLRVEALSMLASELVNLGRRDVAFALVASGAALPSVATFGRDALVRTFDALSSAWLAVGAVDRAVEAARAITDRDRKCRALSQIVEQLAAQGRPIEAVALARDISQVDYRACAIAEVADALLATGERVHAVALLQEAASIIQTCEARDDELWGWLTIARVAQSLGEPSTSIPERIEALAMAAPRTPWSLGWAAKVMLVLDCKERAERLLAQAKEDLAQTSIVWNRKHDAQLRTLCHALLVAGQPADALGLARAIKTPVLKAFAMAALAAETGAEIDDLWSGVLLEEAEVAASSVSEPRRRANALDGVVAASVERGDVARAERLALSVGLAPRRAEILTELALMLADTDSAKAAKLARAAESAARSAATSQLLDWVSDAIRALVALENLDAAEDIAYASSEYEGADERWAQLALASVARDNSVRAARCADQAVKALQRIDHAEQRIWAIATVAEALVAVDQLPGAAALTREALALAHGIEDPHERVEVFQAVIGMAVGCEDHRLAASLAEESLSIADEFDEDDDDRIRGTAAWCLIAAGELDRAAELGRSLRKPDDRVAVLSRVWVKHAEMQRIDRADHLLAEIQDFWRTSTVTGEASGDHSFALGQLAEIALQVCRDGKGVPARRMLEFAEQAACLIVDEGSKSSVISTVVEGFLELADHDHAMALARSIEEPDVRANVLCLCAGREPADVGRELLAEALCTGGWEPPLTALGRIDEQILMVVVEDLKLELGTMVAPRFR